MSNTSVRQLEAQWKKEREQEIAAFIPTNEQAQDIAEAKQMAIESFTSGAYLVAAQHVGFNALLKKHGNEKTTITLLIETYSKAYQNEQQKAFHLSVMELCNS